MEDAILGVSVKQIQKVFSGNSSSIKGGREETEISEGTTVEQVGTGKIGLESPREASRSCSSNPPCLHPPSLLPFYFGSHKLQTVVPLRAVFHTQGHSCQ